MNSLHRPVRVAPRGGLDPCHSSSCPLMGHLGSSLCLLSLASVTNPLRDSCMVRTSARRESRKSFVFFALPSCMPFLPGLFAPERPGREDAKPVGCGRDRNVGVVSTSVRPELTPAAGQVPGLESVVGACQAKLRAPAGNPHSPRTPYSHEQHLHQQPPSLTSMAPPHLQTA